MNDQPPTTHNIADLRKKELLQEAEELLREIDEFFLCITDYSDYDF